MAKETVNVDASAVQLDPKTGRITVGDPKVMDMLKAKGIRSQADLKKPGIFVSITVSGEI